MNDVVAEKCSKGRGIQAGRSVHPYPESDTFRKPESMLTSKICPYTLQDCSDEERYLAVAEFGFDLRVGGHTGIARHADMSLERWLEMKNWMGKCVRSC